MSVGGSLIEYPFGQVFMFETFDGITKDEIVDLLLIRYDFPWTLTKYIPFYGGSDYHDYHHYVGGQSQSNFASVFTYCDYLYGTNKGYRYQKKVLQQFREGLNNNVEQNN
ncbi:hypothetical protein ACP275_09G094800 [Erythranthe tilingii]